MPRETILIADDDPEILSFYRKLFRPATAEFDILGTGSTASTESAASELICRTYEDPRQLIAEYGAMYATGRRLPLCVLDMRMPTMNGLVAAQALRRIDPEINVMICTAFSDVSVRDIQSKLHDRIYVVRKPFAQEEFVLLVQSLVKEWQVRRELTQRTEDLGHSEQHLIITLESLADAVIVTDRSGKVTRINAAAQRVTGWSRAEAEGRPLEDVLSMLDGDPPKLVSGLLERVLDLNGSLDLSDSATLRTQSGRPCPVSANVSPIRYDGALIGLVVVFRDATAERQRQQALEQAVIQRTQRLDEANDDLIAVNKAHTQLLACRSEEEVAEVLVRVLVDRFQAQFARLWVVRPGDRCPTCDRGPLCQDRALCLHLVASMDGHARSDGSPRRIPLGTSGIGIIGRDGHRIVRGDVAADEYVEDREWAAELGPGSFAGFPLRHEGSTFGVLAAFSLAAFSSHRLELMELLADAGGEAIRNVGYMDAISRARETLKTIFEAMPVGIVIIGKDHRIRQANQVALQLTGYENESELVGRLCDEIICQSHPAEHHSMTTKPRTGLSEWLLRRKSGRALPVLRSVVPMVLNNEDVQLAAVIDISNLKVAERAAEDLRRQQQAILDNIPDMAWLKDRMGRYIVVNSALGEACGMTPEAVTGLSDHDLWPSELAEHYETAEREVLESGRQNRGLETMVNRQGQPRWFETIRTPLRDERQEIIGTAGIARDVTEHKLMEQNLLQAQKLEAIGQLAAGIAHEINTPVQYIGDNLLFIRDSMTPLAELITQLAERAGQEAVPLLSKHDYEYVREELPKAIAQSLDGVEKVTHLVRAMKEFAHPGSRDKSSVDLYRLLNNATAITRNEWKFEAELKLELAESLPMVQGHVDELGQVLLNLIVNAAHAIGEQRRRRKSERLGHIWIRAEADGEKVTVRVIDDGPGIPPGVIGRVFDPFFTTKEVGKGTGMGLAIVHDIVVKKHGGTITVNSELGKGAEFVICLPLAAALVV